LIVLYILNVIKLITNRYLKDGSVVNHKVMSDLKFNELYGRVVAYFNVPLQKNQENRVNEVCPTRAMVDNFAIGSQLADIKRENYARITIAQKAQLGKIVKSFRN
jgi:hypothetical protein